MSVCPCLLRLFFFHACNTSIVTHVVYYELSCHVRAECQKIVLVLCQLFV